LGLYCQTLFAVRTSDKVIMSHKIDMFLIVLH
jgi:hypothetical protein